MSDSEFRAVLDVFSRSEPSAAPNVPRLTKVAVLGAGPVGRLLACEALAAGLEVTLHSVFGRELDRLAAAGSITVRGTHLVGSYAVTGQLGDRPAIRLASSVDGAVKGAEAVFVATPATAHSTYAGVLAGSLADGQLVVLAPGRFLGSVELRRTLASHLCPAEVTVADLVCAPYIASEDGAQITVHGVASRISVSSLPIEDAGQVAARLAPMLPMLDAVDSPLTTGFESVTGVLAVAPLVTNTAVMESKAADSVLLKDLIAPGLSSSLLAQLDEERREVGFRFGVRDLPSTAAWLRRTYGDPASEVADDDIATAVQDLEIFDELTVGGNGGPRVIDDVPHTLVPLASAGRAAGVPTPATNTVVSLASALARTDFSRQGRTLDRLGLEGHQPTELRRWLANGFGDQQTVTTWRSV